MEKKDQLRYLVVKVDGGSGVLVQTPHPENTFIFTAKHILFENDILLKSIDKIEIIAYYLDAYKNIKEQVLIAESVFINNYTTNDAAIIKIKKYLIPYEITPELILIGETTNCYLAGYPGNRRNDADPYRDNKIDELIYTTNQNLIEASLKEQNLDHSSIVGQSGGGIMRITDNAINLIGIQSEMANSAEYGRIRFLPISFFLEIIEKNKLPNIPLITLADKSFTGNNIDLSITLKENKTIFDLINIGEWPGSLDLSNDDTKLHNIRVEFEITKVFQKTLSLLKNEMDLFQKEEFEFLGEMLSKILFGKRNNDEDGRKFALKNLEAKLKIGDETKCRIFLDFDYLIDMHKLPWEYTMYYRDEINRQTGIKETVPIQIAADQKQFQLIRRTAQNPVFEPYGNQLFLIILSISESEIFKPNLKNIVFENILIENLPISAIRAAIENTYTNWQKKYGQIPNLVIHYTADILPNNELINNKLLTFFDIFSENYFPNNVQLPVKLVCLHSNESAKIEKDNNTLKGLALEYSKSKIPAVIGFQNPLDSKNIDRFFNVFYEEIMKGADVAYATTAGRNLLKNIPSIPSNAFGSPVLFISTITPICLVKVNSFELPQNPNPTPDLGQNQPSINEATTQLFENEATSHTQYSQLATR